MYGAQDCGQMLLRLDWFTVHWGPLARREPWGAKTHAGGRSRSRIYITTDWSIWSFHLVCSGKYHLFLVVQKYKKLFMKVYSKLSIKVGRVEAPLCKLCIKWILEDFLALEFCLWVGRSSRCSSVQQREGWWQAKTCWRKHSLTKGFQSNGFNFRFKKSSS